MLFRELTAKVLQSMSDSLHFLIFIALLESKVTEEVSLSYILSVIKLLFMCEIKCSFSIQILGDRHITFYS